MRGRGVRGRGGALPAAAATTPGWEKKDEPRSIPAYGATQGPRNRMPPTSKPKDFLDIFFDNIVWDILVDMTNRNAAAKRRAGQQKGVWNPVDRVEMQAFIGLTIATGITRKPTLAMYRDTGHPLTGTPGFGQVMSRDRFLQLMRYLHVNDESLGNPTGDKLYKVRQFITHINDNFCTKYTMGCQISIDESLIPFKGRLSFRQFIPSKRARFGIKCWVMADSSNSFVSRFCVYTGRDANANLDVPLSTRVVRQLVEGMENLNHHLYVDNFYTSPELFNWLLERHIYACGTVRKGRVGFPKELYFSRGRHDRGTTDYRRRGDQLAQCWFDSKGVYFLSTIHAAEHPADTPDAEHTVRRRAANGTIDVPAPPLLHDYNHHMGGVDLADNIIKHYSIGRKTFRAYRRILYHGMELCIHNAYVIEDFVVPHQQAGTQRRGVLQFRLELAEQLVAPYRAAAVHRRVGRPRLTEAERLIGQHTPVHKPGKANNRDCKVCARKARELRKRAADEGGMVRHVKRSNNYCRECDVPLCIGEMSDDGDNINNCFYMWHNIVEHWRV